MAVTPNATDIPVGSQVQLTAKAYDGAFEPVEDSFTWAVKDSTVAQVDANGNVLGTAAGDTNVTASDPTGLYGESQVTVGMAGFWKGSYQIRTRH